MQIGKIRRVLFRSHGIETNDEVLRLLRRVLHNQEKIMSAIDNLTAAETRIETVVGALIADIKTLAAELAAANTNQDPAIQAVADKLNALSDSAQTVVPAATPPTP